MQGQPLRPNQRRQEMLQFLRAKMQHKDIVVRLEGLHGVLEISVNPLHHSSIDAGAQFPSARHGSPVDDPKFILVQTEACEHFCEFVTAPFNFCQFVTVCSRIALGKSIKDVGVQHEAVQLAFLQSCNCSKS
jgi:hypothetical protein